MALMRGLIELLIAAALLFGCLNLLLRKRKRLGITGIAMAGLATVLGAERAGALRLHAAVRISLAVRRH